MSPLNIGYDYSRYPDGVQDFPTLRRYNMVYVDKTEYIYRLTRKPGSYFLSRPRRFGKSLLLSTINAYFSGEKELFEGLAIAELETEWTAHPVVRIDLSQGVFTTIEDARQQLHTQMVLNASRLGVTLTLGDEISEFQELIAKSATKYSQSVVVLIDEYDKPLLESLHEAEELHKHMHDLMRGFYGCLKGSSPYLRFVMITGITKVSHVNIFSGLNNLTDLSLQPWCNAICGISESEMKKYFTEDMATFARINHMTAEDVRTEFKRYYDGYRFAETGENIYNPYSVVLAFQAMKFSNYWFASGTPTHLLRTLTNEDFNFNTLEGYEAEAEELTGVATTDGNPIGLLYQSGYLTIKHYADDVYTLGFPNREVESGFYDVLLQVLYPRAAANGYSALNIRKAAIQGKPQRLVELLDMGLTDYNYNQHKDIDGEAVLNSLLYGLVHALGLNVQSEYHVANGRIDLVIETKRYIYLFEFKVNKSASAAMAQINEKAYANKYRYDPRKLYKIGLNFDTHLRQINDYLIEE